MGDSGRKVHQLKKSSLWSSCLLLSPVFLFHPGLQGCGIVLPTFRMDLLCLVCWLTWQFPLEALSWARLEMCFPTLWIFQSCQTDRISHHKGKQSFFFFLTNVHKTRRKKGRSQGQPKSYYFSNLAVNRNPLRATCEVPILAFWVSCITSKFPGDMMSSGLGIMF